MDPAAPTTYRILLAILTRREASQQELARDLDVSLGQVNRVVRWLEQGGFVERSRAEGRAARGRGKEVYLLVNPTGLLRAISLFRSMPRLRQFTLSVDVPKRKLMSDLARRSVVFCLGTALERYSRFYRADEVSFYAIPGASGVGVEAIRRSLRISKEGITRAACYLLPTKVHGRREELADPRGALKALQSFGFAEKARDGYFTTRVQTVVDLFCDGRAFAARDLLKEMWGVEL
jgi:biotin operon repressor